jgi:hypothetical protein
LLQGAERLGTLDLESPPPGQPLRISFGGIQGIRGSYRRVSQGLKEAGEKTKDREWTVKERLLITNALTRSAEVEVQDRAVTSSSGSVLVDSCNGTTPGSTELRSGVRSWVITVDAGRTEVIDLTTLIRGPLVGKLANFGDLSLENM